MKKYDLTILYDWPIVTRVLVILLICSVVLYGGNKIDIASLRIKLTNNQQQEQELKAEISAVLSQQKAVQREIAKLPIFNAQLKKWENKFISYSNLPELLNQLLKMGADNGLRFALFNPGQAKEDKRYLKIPIKMVAVGSYHQLAGFISQVADLPRIVVIRNFVVSSFNKSDAPNSIKLANPTSEANTLTLALTVDVYYLVEKKNEK